MIEGIRRNRQAILQRMDAAAKRGGRGEEISLLAVTKGRSPEQVQAAYEAGLTAMGENRPQELEQKIQACPFPVEWHLIGQLQTNKIKYIIENVFLFQSLDRPELAMALDREAEKKGLHVSVLLQGYFNAGPGRGGTDEKGLEALLALCGRLPRLTVKGLMGIAPHPAEPEQKRNYFRRMRRLYEAYGKDNGMEILSLGMSDDFEMAIEEGSTLVRIGTALFAGQDQA